MEFEIKDAGAEQKIKDDLKVKEEIKKEIKAIGDNQTASFEELNKQYIELKHTIDSNKGNVDSLMEAKLVKITADITTRQEELDTKNAEKSEKLQKKIAGEAKERDTKMHERMDQVEVLLKRSNEGKEGLSDKEVKELTAEALGFYKDCMVVNDVTGSGATFGKVKKLEKDGINIEAYQNYITSFENFIRKHEKQVSPEDMKALSVGIDPDGGYTVTPQMGNRITTKLYESDPIRQLANIERISTGTLDLRVDWDEAGWGWEGETESGDETSTPTMKKKSIPVHVIYAKPQATQTLLEDSGINIENWLADKVASRFIRGEAASFVSGDGVGKPRGFLTYGNGTDYGEIQRKNIGHATQFTADGLIDVKYTLIEQYLNRCTWLTNRLSVAAIMKLKDGGGNYLWNPGLAEDRTSSILGLPVRMSTTMPQASAGTLSIAIADWKETYTIVDRLGITVQRDPYTAKPFVEFYTRKRLGGDVVNFQSIIIGVIAA